MKKIEAIIRPYLLESVQNALTELEITGMTIMDVYGIGKQKGHTEIYRGQQKEVHFLPKIKIEVIVEDDLVEDCLALIMSHARTGNIGDGKIIVSAIERVIRIRTGEENQDATY